MVLLARISPLGGLRSFLWKKSEPVLCSGMAVRLNHQYMDPPENYEHIVMPERQRLRIVTKVPQYPPQIRPPKMKKNLHFMRGPETVHNTLIHGQYGIVALTGGRLKFGHFEMIRMTVIKKLETSRMFAVWRVDDPWQAISNKGLGKRCGGGKGPISHYVTPVKAGRVIMEVAGKCLLEEVKPMLDIIVNNLPFKAMVVDEKILMATQKMEQLKEERNINPYTYKYLIMNNMCGSQHWVKPIDRIYFGKYV